MNDYQAFRLAYLADAEMSDQIKEGAEFADITEDRIGEILIPMGERQCVCSVINTLQAISTNQPAAMEFFAQFVVWLQRNNRKRVGLGQNITGDFLKLRLL